MNSARLIKLDTLHKESIDVIESDRLFYKLEVPQDSLNGPLRFWCEQNESVLFTWFGAVDSLWRPFKDPGILKKDPVCLKMSAWSDTRPNTRIISGKQ